MSASGDADDGTRYPLLGPEQIVRLDAMLVEIVALRHSGSMTETQFSVLRAAIEQQTRDAEALHRFPLTNADEPTFIRPVEEAGRR